MARTRSFLIVITALALATTSAFAQRKRQKVPVDTRTPEQIRVDKLTEEMLPSTQMVIVIDSVVVPVDEVITAVPLPKDYGRFVMYSQLFGEETQSDACVFVNGFGNKCYYSQMTADSIARLYSRTLLNGTWSDAQQIAVPGYSIGNTAYPYMSADGTTLYFGAVSDEGLGGYDIHVTSYDAEEARYLKADNIGLPFNSTADDLFYITDDIDSLAWFASTRRQPEGYACVYTIALSSTRKNYDYEETDASTLKSLAAIERIADTWSSEEARTAAMQRLNALKERNAIAEPAPPIFFVIDDNTVYTSTHRFATAANAQAYGDIEEKQRLRDEMASELEMMRTQYHDADENKRKEMQKEIQETERNIRELDESIFTATNNLITKEKQSK